MLTSQIDRLRNGDNRIHFCYADRGGLLNITDFVVQIPNMPDTEIIKALSHENVIVRVKAICEVVRRHLIDADTTKAVKALKDDSTSFWNQYLVEDFAVAALDILGIEMYQGQNERIIALVKSRLYFD